MSDNKEITITENLSIKFVANLVTISWKFPGEEKEIILRDTELKAINNLAIGLGFYK